MKRTVASLIAGIVIGSTGVGIASTQDYWKQGGRTFSCSGDAVSVFCKETNWRTNYKVAIFPSLVTVSHGSKVVFGCKRKYPPAHNCESFVPGP